MKDSLRNDLGSRKSSTQRHLQNRSWNEAKVSPISSDLHPGRWDTRHTGKKKSERKNEECKTNEKYTHDAICKQLLECQSTLQTSKMPQNDFQVSQEIRNDLLREKTGQIEILEAGHCQQIMN